MAQVVNKTTSFMTEVFSDLKNIKASKGFLSFFGRSIASKTAFVNDAEQVTVDIIRGEKKISKVLQRTGLEGEISIGTNVTNTQAQNYQNVSRAFPIIKERASVQYSKTLNRVAGEIPVNSGKLSVERARQIIADELYINFPKMVGAMEKMAVESITAGTITLDDGGAYDFDRSTTNTITPGTLWSVVATADPVGDMDDICDSVQENGKTEPNASIMGWEAWKAFLATDQISNFADNRRFSFVQAGDKMGLPPLPTEMAWMEMAGFKYQGYLHTFKGRGICIFTYNEKYQNAGGTWVDYMNSKDVVVFDPAARFDRFFGPMIRFDFETEEDRIVNEILGIQSLQAQVIQDQNVSDVILPQMFHYDPFVNKSKTVMGIEHYTGPLLVPTQVDAVGLLDGVIA